MQIVETLIMAPVGVLHAVTSPNPCMHVCVRVLVPSQRQKLRAEAEKAEESGEYDELDIECFYA
jgi:hypothetical protein